MNDVDFLFPLAAKYPSPWINVIKLSDFAPKSPARKNAHTSKREVGIFLTPLTARAGAMAIAPKRDNDSESPAPNGAEFALYAMRSLRGQDDDLSLVNGVRVLQAVGVALENRLVLRGASVVRLRDRAERIAREDGIERFARASGRGSETHSVAELVGQNDRRALFQHFCVGIGAVAGTGKSC